MIVQRTSSLPTSRLANPTRTARKSLLCLIAPITKNSVAALRVPRSEATLPSGLAFAPGRGNHDQTIIEQGGASRAAEAALASYNGTVTYCPPATRPEPEPEEPDLEDDEQECAADDTLPLELEV
jgi:hypothetical protein